MPTYMGIDPGASGGIATVGSMIQAFPMPKTERDLWQLINNLSKQGVDFAYIEKVHAMPKQGVTSMFSFGQNYGMLRGMMIATGIPFDEVTPQKWQKRLECLTKGDKNVSKAKAQQLFPNLKVTHATADALLIAQYCYMSFSSYGKEVAWDRDWDNL
jgi:crossover junction endodeoxyribonuclease RuvC